MPQTTKLLKGLHGQISEVMKVSGTVGLSLGVIQHGEVIFKDNFGFRDRESKLPVNDETVFNCCSLTKALVSAAVGILVDDGRLEWDTPVKEVLPEFHPKSQILRDQTIVADLLSHRTGMSTSNYWLGSQNNILISLRDSMTFLNSQQQVKPIRGQFQYNNLGYELAGHIIDKISGSSWHEFLRSNIFSPLGLKRTDTRWSQGESNVAKAYATLDDAAPVLIDHVKAGDDAFGGANGGMRSTLNDLLKLYASVMKAAEHQRSTEMTSTPGSPFKQLTKLLSAAIPLRPESFLEQSYAFGWVRAQLPNPMGAVGINPGLMPDGMPVVAKGEPSRLVIYHQGSLPGALTAVTLLPETQSAIVVLSNSLALNDCADWVNQMVLETLLEVEHKNDYLVAAETSVSHALGWHDKVASEINSNKTSQTPPRDIHEYKGTYYNSARTMMIEVTVKGDKLYFAQQGLKSEMYSLEYLYGDVFSWLQSRNELAGRGRFTHQVANYYLIRFQGDDKSGIKSLAWTHDRDVPQGEEFSKQ